MLFSHKTPSSSESATILEFPNARTRSDRRRGERVVAETYWMIVATAADGSTTCAKMRSPRFLSPRRAYTSSEGARCGVRSLLLYKFRRRPAAPQSDRTRRDRAA